MPIAYYNNTLYRQSNGQFVLLFRECTADGQPVGLTFGDTTYPGAGSENGVFVLKNNIWWSELPMSTFTLGYSGCSTIPTWNFNNDSLRTKNNLFKNIKWQQWYGRSLYTSNLSDVQKAGNDASNGFETASRQTAVAASSAFANVTDGNFTPTATSPARNIGTALTTVKTAISNSTIVTVDRASYFFDGYCIGSECVGTPDWIRIGNSAVVQVLGANATTNVLTLSAAVTAAANDLVSISVHPIQGILLKGHTPDVGSAVYVAEFSSPMENSHVRH